MNRSLSSLLAIVFLSPVCACDREKPREETPAYGDPVGVQMSAAGGVPAFEIALAVSRDVDVTPLVPPLSGLLFGAIKACPSFVGASAPGGVTQVAFSVNRGKVHGVATSGDHPDPCIASHLDDQQLALQQGSPPPEVRVLAQIRFAAGPSKPADDPEAP